MEKREKDIEELRKKTTEKGEKHTKNFSNETEEVGGENTKEVQKIANHECPGKKKAMKVSVAERIKELERNIGKNQQNEWLELD